MKTELRKRISSQQLSTGENVSINDVESQLIEKNVKNQNELEKKISEMDENDLRMKIDNDFTDRHLFSQLCYRNFAHLPDLTRIVHAVIESFIQKSFFENFSLFNDLITREQP